MPPPVPVTVTSLEELPAAYDRPFKRWNARTKKEERGTEPVPLTVRETERSAQRELLAVLRLVDAGKSVIVIEHHQAVMAHADWIIDLGPGAGHDGGQVVFEGTPAQLVAKPSTLTGTHLAAFVAAKDAGGRRTS